MTYDRGSWVSLMSDNEAAIRMQQHRPIRVMHEIASPLMMIVSAVLQRKAIIYDGLLGSLCIRDWCCHTPLFNVTETLFVGGREWVSGSNIPSDREPYPTCGEWLHSLFIKPEPSLPLPPPIGPCLSSGSSE